MSPMQRKQAIEGIVKAIGNHSAVIAVKLAPPQYSGIGQGDEVLAYEVVRVDLHPKGRQDGAHSSVINLFWNRVRDMGISPQTLLLEIDGEPRPYFDPPI